MHWPALSFQIPVPVPGVAVAVVARAAAQLIHLNNKIKLHQILKQQHQQWQHPYH